MSRTALVLIILLLAQREPEWTTPGGDPGARRFSALTQITRENVSTLQQAWSFDTGATNLQGTPTVVGGLMYVTGGPSVFALEPETGKQVWRFDAQKRGGTSRRRLLAGTGRVTPRVYVGVRRRERQAALGDHAPCQRSCDTHDLHGTRSPAVRGLGGWRWAAAVTHRDSDRRVRAGSVRQLPTIQRSTIQRKGSTDLGRRRFNKLVELFSPLSLELLPLDRWIVGSLGVDPAYDRNDESSRLCRCSGGGADWMP